MDKIKKVKSQRGIFVFLYFFFFSKIFLVVPVKCLGLKTDYPIAYTFSVETISTWILVAVFSFVAVLLISKLYRIHGAVAAVICIFALAEPFFSSSLNTPVKLFVTILGILCFHIGIAKKNVVISGVALNIFLFISSLLLPFSVLSYVVLALSIYMIMSEKSKAKFIFFVSGIVCSCGGLILNKVFNNAAEGFSAVMSNFSFADVITEVKSLKMTVAFLPFFILAVLFVNYYLRTANKLQKKNKSKENKSNLIFNIVLFNYICSVAGIILFSGEAFLTFNIILLIVILNLVIIKDEACLNVIKKVKDFLKVHPVWGVVCVVIIYYLSMRYTDNFYSAQKLIDFVRY